MLQGGEGEAPRALSSPSGARVLSMGRIVSSPHPIQASLLTF